MLLVNTRRANSKYLCHFRARRESGYVEMEVRDFVAAKQLLFMHLLGSLSGPLVGPLTAPSRHLQDLDKEAHF
jgi:hypothetical protein